MTALNRTPRAMTQKPEPCPHCGGEARLVRKTGLYGTACPSQWLREYVVCKTRKCAAMSAVFKRPGQAVAAWNKRFAPATEASQ